MLGFIIYKAQSGDTITSQEKKLNQSVTTHPSLSVKTCSSMEELTTLAHSKLKSMSSISKNINGQKFSWKTQTNTLTKASPFTRCAKCFMNST